MSTTDQQIQTIMAEKDDWLRLLAQPADTAMDVYLDMKSPHAYLAVRPTLEIARDFKVTINFLPYTLSYETLGVSRSIEKDMQRRPASAAADRKARMYYATAREYAACQSLPLKSPSLLLDSSLAHRAFLYAKTQQLEVPFVMWVYLQGWASGWQAFNLTSLNELKAASEAVGIDTQDFDRFVSDDGLGVHQLAEIMETAHQLGLVGTPHYVFTDPIKQRTLGLFGREHLSLIRSKFKSAGFARNADVRADFSHAWTGPGTV